MSLSVLVCLKQPPAAAGNRIDEGTETEAVESKRVIEKLNNELKEAKKLS